MTAARRLAWGLFALTLASAVVQAVLFLSGSAALVSAEFGLNSFPMITGGAVLGALVGALVATRHPRNPIGWLLLAGQLGTAVGLALEAYSYRVLQQGDLGPRTAGQVARLVSSGLGARWTLTVLAAAFLLFPDGRLPSRRWRPVLWLAPLPEVFSVLAIGSARLHSVAYRGQDGRPSAAALVADATSAGLSVLVLLLSVVALILRRNRSRGVQRQQLRWLAFAGAGLVAGFVVAQFDNVSVWAVIPLFVAYASVPVAAGVAILRYRLYDIDLVISRAVVLSAALTFVTVGYVAAVVVLGPIVGGRVSDRFWTSALATAVVAVAFQLVRERVSRFADRVVYGRRAAPYQALAAFSHQLAGSLSVAEVLPVVAEATGHGLAAAQVTVRLALPAADDLVVRWPLAAPARTSDVVVPVWQDKERLGDIGVCLQPGRRWSDSDRVLLDGIATQAGLGFRNAQLAAQLAARVADASRQTDELESSHRRVLAAQESQRQRLARAVRTEVLPHLSLVRDALAGARRLGDAADCSAVRGALDSAGRSSQVALDALRDIARGVYPPALARQGLVAALTGYAARHPDLISLSVAAQPATAPPDPQTQALAYFCCVESVRELGGAEVGLDLSPERLVLTVRGRDRTGLIADGGQSLRDRVESLGGTVRLDVEPDGRSTLTVDLPPTVAAAYA